MNRSLFRRILAEAKTRWYQRVFRKPVQLRSDAPVVSITFDDVPYSTFQNGLPILDDYGVKGTFYICRGVDTLAEKPLMGRSEITTLHAAGHEISCHTFTHHGMDEWTSEEMAADCARNRLALAELLGDAPSGFAFPYGDLSISAKKALAPDYDYLRSTRPGINHGVVDFNCLRAVALHPGRCTSAISIDRCLDQVQRRNGWLITYTHGILNAPGKFDISPEVLEHLLSECRRRGIQVIPVSQVARSALARAPATALA